MKAALLALGLALGLSALCEARIHRDGKVIAEFKRLNPCPANGARRGQCPGFQVDHIEPLCAGGADALPNLHWITIADHQAKTRLDVARCRLLRHADAPLREQAAIDHLSPLTPRLQNIF